MSKQAPIREIVLNYIKENGPIKVIVLYDEIPNIHKLRKPITKGDIIKAVHNLRKNGYIEFDDSTCIVSFIEED